jgi:hypothetical protein
VSDRDPEVDRYPPHGGQPVDFPPDPERERREQEEKEQEEREEDVARGDLQA